MADAALSIGDVAARAGINVSAIRYYERRGLLPQPERVSGRRRYTPETVQRLRMIDAGKRAGFSLAQLRSLLDSTDAGAPAHEQLRVLAARKLPEIDALIERAQTMREWLALATACECETLERCALFAGSGPVAEPGLPTASPAQAPRP